MSEYLVTVVIGTEYLYLVEANNEEHARDIIEAYEQTPNDPNHLRIEELETEAGRAITEVLEFERPTCDTCEELQIVCEAHSEHAAVIKDALTRLASECNDTMSEYIHEVLDSYLTHGVSPCNTESKA
jgi:predicted HAD superfamily Cof-like phosphohydrolase